MEIVEIINTPKMAKAAMGISKELVRIWAKREFLFWEKLEKELRSYLKDKKLRN